MQHTAELRRCLLEVDVDGIVKLWRHVAPHLPQPTNSFEATAAIHMARVQMESMPLKSRYYSHCWLRDAALPSQLPDALKPSAERMFPVGARAVAIAVKNVTPLALGVRGVMEDAVRETYADGHERQPLIVKARMLEMRGRFLRRL